MEYDQTSLNRTARVAAVLYLLLIPFGFFGVAYVPVVLEVPGDIEATVANLQNSAWMFRLSIVASLIMNVISIFLVLQLGRLFSHASKHIAEAMVVIMLFGAGISLLNEVGHFAALSLIDPSALAAFGVEQRNFLVKLALELHKNGAYIAVIFWGLWLFPLGYLIIRSRLVPRLLAVLLIVAGVGYLADCGLQFLLPEIGPWFSDYTFIGEILFPLWLLIRGVKFQPSLVGTE
jgi:hypothetical protein